MTGGLEGARCVGLGALFSSTNLSDHAEARAICADCPAIRACRSHAHDVINDTGTSAVYGIQGTWAGRLYGRVGRPRPEPNGARRAVLR